MATVVITLLIITRFYVSKMDADSEERRRDRISRREKRWSMNSQRLEQIVAELMRPIGDLRRSFDTDLSALLEEYLTEAGLHALEAEGSPGGPGAGAGGAPNFPELALLLQQSANIYGRKVDFLYQHVLAVSESLQLSTTELSQSAEAEAEASPGAARRRRRASAGAGGGGGWARVALEPAPAARREPPARPPPTLPRLFAELEPRVLGAADAPLRDYAGEPVGLLHDFHVAWRLHGGLLVDELECGDERAPALRAIPLCELQAALEAAAPPSPRAPACSTPLPPEDPPPTGPAPDEETPAPDESPAPRRKRKADPRLYEDGAGKLFITPELGAFLRTRREFSVPRAWLARVVCARRARLLAARARLPPPPAGEAAAGPVLAAKFRGFDDVDRSDIIDIGGFLGFETSSVAEREVLYALSRLAEAVDSDDDGFFEQSSLGSEGSARLEPPSPPPAPAEEPEQPAAEWAAWRAGVVARAAAGAALDVRALAAAVLRALPEGGAGAAFPRVLAQAAAEPADVSRLFLATLFLANAGNVEVSAGAPLSLGTFSLRLVSRDERRYCAAAAADPAFLAR